MPIYELRIFYSHGRNSHNVCTKYRLTRYSQAGFTPHHFLINGLASQKTTRKSGAGFTLIEALVAIVVITLGIVAVLQIFPISIQTVKSAEMSTIASQLGQEKIEETISKPYEGISTGTTTEEYGTISDFKLYKRVTVVNCVNPSLQVVSCNYDLTNDPNPLKKVEVTVFWKSPLGVTEKNFKISSLISKR